MTEKLRSINRENVVDQVIRIITDAIVDGKYPAGAKLPNEYELIEELKVSRNSLREAMKILSAMGIVDIRRGDGTYVCSEMKPTIFDNAVFSIIYGMSTDAELLELRRVMDEQIARLSMEKITPEETEALEANIGEMERALGAGDYEQVEKLDFAFHQMLIDTSKNRFFIHIMTGIYAIFERSITRTVEYEKEMSRVVEHHRKILDCVKRRDREHIAQVIEDSLSTWKK